MYCVVRIQPVTVYYYWMLNFKVVSLQAPSVVFIDELDAVGRERGLIKGSGGQERDATLNQVPDIIDCVIVVFFGFFLWMKNV